MRIPLFDLRAQHESLFPQFREALDTVIAQAAFVGGDPVAELERSFASYLVADHVVACANGTDALEIAIEALGLGEDDEIIVPSMTWVSSAEAVARMGCTPVFADILDGEWTIDPDAIAAAITRRTRAIMPVHLYGRPARMDAIMQLAKAHSLLVIEDCAQAHGGAIGDEKLGTLGDAAIFSFFPTKNLGGLGDGGAMVFRNKEAASRALLIAHHGQQERHRHVLIGRNSRLDALHAAVLSIKLPHLDNWIEAKQALADRYRAAFADLPIECPPAVSRDSRHAWHLFTIATDRRDDLARHCHAHGIATAVHYPTPLTDQPAFAQFVSRPGLCPVARRLGEQVLSIPLYPELSTEDESHIVATIRAFFS